MRQPFHMKKRTGFTLIESLVAVTIITLAIIGPLVTANRAVIAARTARDQLTASYLAQEGVEYVRALRDNGYLSAYRSNSATASSVGWTTFLTSVASCRTTTVGSAPFCSFDPEGSGSLNACTGTCTPLWLAVNNVYTQTQTMGSTATPFTRRVQTVSVNATDEKIVSTVSWSYHGTTYTVTISDHLTPWQ